MAKKKRKNVSTVVQRKIRHFILQFPRYSELRSKMRNKISLTCHEHSIRIEPSTEDITLLGHNQQFPKEARRKIAAHIGEYIQGS